tara:strand:+ start:830 stop:1054 length:225 start_codon:yes stop_codon:yes gene_type:complete
MIESNFLTKTKFSKMVEKAVIEYRMSYIDAVVELCGRSKMELEDISKFITPVLKEKIAAEAMSLNCLPKQNSLF